jgi:hypothetical protein
LANWYLIKPKSSMREFFKYLRWFFDTFNFIDDKILLI